MSFTDFMFYPKTAAVIVLLAVVQLLFRRRQETAGVISKAVLLLYSFYTFVYYDYRFALCIAFVIGITYFAALKIEGTDDRARKIWTRSAVIALVVFLGIFKYFNFFAENISALFGHEWTTLSIILPLGISFYIFSAISYVLDVSWGNMHADRNLLNVALFLAFFPKIVCGPIVKGRDFLPQLQEYRRVKWDNVCIGIQIYVFGLFKKMVLADHLALFVDEVYSKPAAYGTATVWFAVFSYMLQLYLDFSGYSDMAIGLFKILGYDVKPNFNLPFVSTTISEFWNRWHISLGDWLTEYLFNPIALSFKRKMAGWDREKRKKYKMLPTYAAVIITFFVSGVWHGAGWTFVVFGILHGCFSVMQQMYGNWVHKKKWSWAQNKKRWLYVVDILLNFVLIVLIQVIFRAGSLDWAAEIYKQLFTLHVGLEQPYTWSIFAYVLLVIATVFAYRKSNGSKLKWDKEAMQDVEGYYIIQDLSTVKGLTCFFVLCGLTIIMGYFGETYFVYGQF